MTGRSLVPTFKTATSETAEHNFVISLLLDVGLPNVLVYYCNSARLCFTSTFWTCWHEAHGTTLVFSSHHHHNTTCKAERVNCVIAAATGLAHSLPLFTGERANDWSLWSALMQLVGFVINYLATSRRRPSF